MDFVVDIEHWMLKMFIVLKKIYLLNVRVAAVSSSHVPFMLLIIFMAPLHTDIRVFDYLKA